MYGHLDKQPFGDGWKTDPCDPVIKDGWLYGRGSSDDGYALFTAITSIKACQALGKSHPKVVITIEGSEEGEIFDLIHYLKKHKELLDSPTLVVCLDSVAFTEETITITSSLRGCINFDIKAIVAENNTHSGMGGGVVPNPYNILNCLLMRIQNFKTQEVIPELQLKEIPKHRLEDMDYMGNNLAHMTKGLPMFDSTKSMAYYANPTDPKKENIQLHINNFWRSQLAVIGIEGLPTNIASAGNVIYKDIKFRCSLRIPPQLSSQKVVEILKEKLTAEGEDTFGAKIELEVLDAGDGFDAPDLPEPLKGFLNQATQEVFGQDKKPLYVGCGGSIPFMEVFSQEFPKANFLLTGVGFADSNAHSANENLRLDYCKKLTTALAVFLSKVQ